MFDRPDRRRFLRLLAGVSVLPLIGCASDSSDGTDGAPLPDGAAGADGRVGAGDCTSAIPSETEGPYPGDGTNGPNALSLSGIERSDIRASIAGATGLAEGVPLTITLRLVATGAACEALAGYAIYLWHCDRAGDYSMYSAAAADENYLRGVQQTDENGEVTFTTIFPACYAGRWPHAHFEIFPSLASATAGGNSIHISQLALPKSTCDEVYAESGYEQSVRNLASLSLETDGIFRDDGGERQLVSISGDVGGGYAATLIVPVSV